MNNWYVITGAQGSGKSTTLEALSKLGYTTVPEAARTVIDEANIAGITTSELRKDELEFQETVIKRKEAIEASLPQSEIVFLDRGMHDTIAYLEAYNFPISQHTKELCKKSIYRKVFILEPLELYENDYARIEDAAFVQSLHKLLISAFEKYGMQPILVPRASVNERVKFIISSTQES